MSTFLVKNPPIPENPKTQSNWSTSPPPRFLPTRNNNYILRDKLPGDVIDNSVDVMIYDLYENAMNMASSAGKQANGMKIVTIIADLLVIVAGAVIGVVSLFAAQNRASYIASALGFVISAIQGIVSTFSLQKRSVLLKEDSYRLRKAARGIRQLQYAGGKKKAILARLEEYHAEIDEIDMHIFDNNVDSRSGRVNKRIQTGSIVSSESEEYSSGETPKNVVPIKALKGNPPNFTTITHPPHIKQFPKINNLKEIERLKRNRGDVVIEMSTPKDNSDRTPPKDSTGLTSTPELTPEQTPEQTPEILEEENKEAVVIDMGTPEFIQEVQEGTRGKKKRKTMNIA